MIRILFTTLFIGALSIASQAQSKQNYDPKLPSHSSKFRTDVPFTSPPDPIPVDGGLGFLLAAGAGYSLKRLRDQKKKS